MGRKPNHVTIPTVIAKLTESESKVCVVGTSPRTPTDRLEQLLDNEIECENFRSYLRAQLHVRFHHSHLAGEDVCHRPLERHDCDGLEALLTRVRRTFMTVSDAVAFNERSIVKEARRG